MFGQSQYLGKVRERPWSVTVTSDTMLKMLRKVNFSLCCDSHALYVAMVQLINRAFGSLSISVGQGCSLLEKCTKGVDTYQVLPRVFQKGNAMTFF